MPGLVTLQLLMVRVTLDLWAKWKRNFVWLCFLAFVGSAVKPRCVLAKPSAVHPGIDVDVLTQRYDNQRSGRNTHESQLNLTSVTSKSFGKLFSRDVDGEIYAQPLIVTGLNIPGKGTRNVVFIATEHNSVYAFDAENPNESDPFWHDQMGTPVPTTDVGEACGVYKDFSKEVGITGTPVIDRASSTLYVVTRTKLKDDDVEKQGASLVATDGATLASSLAQVAVTSVTSMANANSTSIDAEKDDVIVKAILHSSSNYRQYFHALDLATGKERLGSPVEIRASVPGKGRGSVNGILTFNPLVHNQRPALVMHQGVVYVSWAGHCDSGDYHGWVIGYNAKTLRQTGAFCTTPDGLGAGIWQSGTGPVVDASGHLYLVAGNGTVDTDSPAKVKTEYGSSILKLDTASGKITVADWFTPYNFTSLNDADLDTGSTALLPLPGGSVMVTGSKAGVIYVVDKNNFGGFDMFGDRQIVQKFKASQGFMYSTPLIGEIDGRQWLYSWGMDDRLKAFEWNGSQFNPVPVSQSKPDIHSPRPGGFLSFSSSGHDPQTAILWALQPMADANQTVVAGVLRAFDASDLTREIWDSRINADRDDVGKFAKFCAPVVANGKVYMASFSNELEVYGLNPPGQAIEPTIVSRSGTTADFVTIENDQPLTTVHYTLDGSNPTLHSALYRTPFKMDRGGRIMARSFKTGLLPSRISSALIMEAGVVGTGNGLLGTYFADKNLDQQLFERLDKQVVIISPPKPGNTNWSARWTGQVQAARTGETTFSTYSDDGVRLKVDGKLLIDNWTNHVSTLDSGKIVLEAGRKYDITLEYYQVDQGAVCRLLWTPPGQPQMVIPQSQLYSDTDPVVIGTGTGLAASYFSNKNLEGPETKRIDAQINDIPRPNGLIGEEWSARWAGQIQAPISGTYKFTTFSDDGIRLWIDNKLLVDDWKNHPVQEDNAVVALEAGKKYAIKVEYFQGGSLMAYRLMWAPPGMDRDTVPQSQLYPETDDTHAPGNAATRAGVNP